MHEPRNMWLGKSVVNTKASTGAKHLPLTRRRQSAVSILSPHWIIAATYIVLRFFVPFTGTKFGYSELRWGVWVLWLLAYLVTQSNGLMPIWRQLNARRIEALAGSAWLVLIFGNCLFNRGPASALQWRHGVEDAMIYSLALIYASRHDGSYRALLVLGLVIVALCATSGIPVLMNYPLLLRNSLSQSWLREEAYGSGLGSFAETTGNMLVLPALLGLGLIQVGWRRWGILACCVPLMILALMSTLSGNLLLLILGPTLIFYLYLQGCGKLKTALTAAVVMCAILGFSWRPLCDTLLASPLWETESSVADNPVRFIFQKAVRIITGVQTEGVVGGDSSGRAELALRSLDTIRQHPLFGVGAFAGVESATGWSLIGGHASWLDTIAEQGFVGFSIYCLFFGTMVRRIFAARRRNRNSPVHNGVLAVCGLWTVYGWINPVLWLGGLTQFVLFVLAGLGDDVKNGPGRRSLFLSAASPQAVKYLAAHRRWT